MATRIAGAATLGRHLPRLLEPGETLADAVHAANLNLSQRDYIPERGLAMNILDNPFLRV